VPDVGLKAPQEAPQKPEEADVAVVLRIRESAGNWSESELGFVPNVANDRELGRASGDRAIGDLQIDCYKEKKKGPVMQRMRWRRPMSYTATKMKIRMAAFCSWLQQSGR
jgi:hypothetical protein